MVLDWGLVVQRLVGSFKVVFDQPFGEPVAEQCEIIGHIAHLDKLIRQGPVKAFVSPVIFQGSRT